MRNREPEHKVRAERAPAESHGLVTIAQAIKAGEEALSNHDQEYPRLDAEYLLAHCLGCSRTQLYTRYSEVIPNSTLITYELALARRGRGEPIQYITEVREFWGLDFRVTPAVLIPRPETELIVENALKIFGEPNAVASSRIVDLGSGSGCMAVALAIELTDARVIAVDLSLDALRIGCENAERHGVRDRIDFVQSDGLTGLNSSRSTVDLIVCNPPYISQAEFNDLPYEVRQFEPRCALTDEGDGLGFYRKFIPESAARVKPGGHLILELSTGQSDRVISLIEKSDWDVTPPVKDLQGHDRCLVLRRRGLGEMI
ncbi:MAG: peptide chain release factor N(5)-glutamine methyltransferase [Acidobacteria bacterium]|nr:peptide chain release factor N(5)-glutamine methyltransferase [Acidobacteriota bacterium]MBI3655334.1 peptide chain release factor N(5)-glutamine methyltransferase [Acidobacteriota bacterium]